MWTAIGIFLVLAFIGNLIKKKEPPATKSGSRTAEPIVDVEKRKAHSRQLERVIPPVAPPSLFDNVRGALPRLAARLRSIPGPPMKPPRCLSAMR